MLVVEPDRIDDIKFQLGDDFIGELVVEVQHRISLFLVLLGIFHELSEVKRLTLVCFHHHLFSQPKPL